MSQIYCGNNAKDSQLVAGNVILGTRYKCLQKGIGKGMSLPHDPNFAGEYEPIDNRTIYCGNSPELPDGYDMMGNLPQCLQKGIGVGKTIKAKQKLPAGWKSHVSRAGKTFYENISTGKTQWEIPVDSANGRPHADLPDNWESRTSSTTGDVFFHNTKTGTTQWEYPGTECPAINGLKWKDNSCYVDSVLIALFAQPSKWADSLLDIDLARNPLPKLAGGIYHCGSSSENDILNRQSVQRVLREVVQSIRGEKPALDYCTDLRQSFRNCPDPENYHDFSMKDAGEFLGYLISLFPVNTSHRRKITYATNDMSAKPDQKNLVQTSTTVDKHASVIQFVDPFLLLEQEPDMMLSTYLVQTFDSYPDPLDPPFQPDNMNGSYVRRITVDSLERGDCVIFSLKRTVGDDQFVDKSVIPDESITLPSGQRYNLTSIVIYSDKHFICTFRCDKNWYLYDDFTETGEYDLRSLGIYQNMLRINPNPTTNGTLYFYTT